MLSRGADRQHDRRAHHQTGTASRGDARVPAAWLNIMFFLSSIRKCDFTPACVSSIFSPGAPCSPPPSSYRGCCSRESWRTQWHGALRLNYRTLPVTAATAKCATRTHKFATKDLRGNKIGNVQGDHQARPAPRPCADPCAEPCADPCCHEPCCHKPTQPQGPTPGPAQAHPRNSPSRPQPTALTTLSPNHPHQAKPSPCRSAPAHSLARPNPTQPRSPAHPTQPSRPALTKPRPAQIRPNPDLTHAALSRPNPALTQP